MLKLKIFTLLCLISLAFAVPINDDRIVFQDDDLSEFQNKIFKSDNKDNYRRDSSAKIVKELENGQFYQGDIILHGDQKDLVNSHKNFTENPDNIPSRTGLINEQYRWPKNYEGFAVIPYEIDPASGYCEWSSYESTVSCCFWCCLMWASTRRLNFFANGRKFPLIILKTCFCFYSGE